MAGTSNVLPSSCPYKLNGFRFNRGNVVENCKTDNDLLLDMYGGAAIAYSLRELRTGVTNVVRVRRSSDSSEQDFTASEVTDGTLTTFTGAGDGFVVTWYDQSGNANNATQSTANLQPQIVSSGSVVTDGASKEAINFTNISGTIRHLDIGTISASTSDVTLVCSIDSENDLTNHYLLDCSTGRLIFEPASTEAALWDGSAIGVNFGGSDPSILTWLLGTTLTVRDDGADDQTSLAYTQRALDGTIALGSNNAGTGSSVEATLNEVVLWLSDRTSEIADIESNINTAWSRF